MLLKLLAPFGTIAFFCRPRRWTRAGFVRKQPSLSACPDFSSHAERSIGAQDKVPSLVPENKASEMRF